MLSSPLSPSAFPRPEPGERPTVYADRVGAGYAAAKSDQHRKGHGLYLTPVLAADFMAACLRVSGGGRLRLLDPAAGAGVLCCAAVEAIVAREPRPVSIECIAYEVDADLIAALRTVLAYLTAWCRARYGMGLEARVEAADFVMAHAGALTPGGSTRCGPDERFDAVISNPPYFKIGRTDPRAVAVPTVVHGQPNIYALFMAVSAALLRAGGDFVYNSRLLDTYFRCVNGNTQVNATELRAMPLPAREVIVSLGRLVRDLHDPLGGLDELVMSLLSGAQHAGWRQSHEQLRVVQQTRGASRTRS